MNLASIGKSLRSPGKGNASVHREEWPRIREIFVKGNVFYQVDPRPHARRETFASLVKAKTRAGQLAKDREEHGKQGLLAPLKDRVLLAELHEEVAAYGKTLREAVETAKRVWEEDRERESSVSMGVALDQWLEAKEKSYRAGKLQPRTIKNLRPLVREFRSAFGHMNVLAVTPDSLHSYEEERPAQARTLITKRAKLSEFFRFALVKEWRRDNPIERLHLLFPIKAKRSDVSILSVEDCRTLLKLAKEAENAAELVPYVALSLFAGLRPSEVERLDWKQIHFEESQIEVLADTSKNAESRFVPIEENLRSWLRPHQEALGRIVPETNWRRKWDALRIAAGYSLRGENKKGRIWPEDVLRHSYASYWLAVHANRPRLAEQMGNSVEVIRSHYRRAIPPQAAKAFWELVP